MRIEDFLRATALRLPDKIALVAGGERISYRELDVQSDRLASALIQGGVCRGDRVLLLLDNMAETVISLYAAFKAGAVACPLNPSTKVEKLSGICDRVAPAAVIAQARLKTIAEQAFAADILRIVVASEGPESGPRWQDFGAIVASPQTHSLPVLASVVDL